MIQKVDLSNVPSMDDTELGKMYFISSDMTEAEQQAAGQYNDKKLRSYYRAIGKSPEEIKELMSDNEVIE